MAENVLTNGQPSGAGENSSSPAQTWTAQQAAINEAQAAQEAASKRAADAAFARASRRPGTNGQQNPGIGGMATYDAHGQRWLPNPRKGKKG